MRSCLMPVAFAAGLLWISTSRFTWAIAQANGQPSSNSSVAASPGPATTAAPSVPAVPITTQGSTPTPVRGNQKCNLQDTAQSDAEFVTNSLGWQQRPLTSVITNLVASYTSRQSGQTESATLNIKTSPLGADWDHVNFVIAARSNSVFASQDYPEVFQLNGPKPGSVHLVVPLQATLIERNKDAGTNLLVTLPSNRSGYFTEGWTTVIAVCKSDNDSLVGYAVASVNVTPWGRSVVIALTALLATWFVLTMIAWKAHAERLQEAWLRLFKDDKAKHDKEAAKPPVMTWPVRLSIPDSANLSRLWWKFWRATDPVFISQDALGCGSFSRLQLLMFSIAVAAVVTYVLLRVGLLPSFSSDILKLLGISGITATVSRLVVGGPAFSMAGHRLLFGKEKFIHRTSQMPTYQEVVSGEGEIDITRVQAVLFSFLVIVALVSYGVYDLAHFQIPAEMIELLGISQGVYVFGKMIPSEASKRVSDQVDALINMARDLRDPTKTKDSSSLTAFESAKKTVSYTLEAIYGPSFDFEKFSALAPDDVA